MGLKLNWIMMISFWLTLSSCFGSVTGFCATPKAQFRRQYSHLQPQVQERFFQFSAELFKWAAYFSSLRKNDTEPLREIYFRIPDEKADRFFEVFSRYRDVLYAFKKIPCLNTIGDLPIFPPELYEYIKESFAQSKLSGDHLDRSQALIKIIGGDFDFGRGRELKVVGLIDFVDKLDMNSWQPVKRFIRSFSDTLALDARLSKQLGRTLLPLVTHYYEYTDVISRLRIFKELAQDLETIDLGGQSQSENLDQLAINIFQNSGPVMVKLLQQLQEDVCGNSPMTPVLAGLKTSKAMDPERVARSTRNEFKVACGKNRLNAFEFHTDPLGIASIAQTHLVRFAGKKYVVKVQKDKISDVFNRERENLLRLVNEKSIFDKGMKQKIENTNQGILEELDFHNERRHIKIANSVYSNNDDHINTITSPEKFAHSKEGHRILIMSLAEGESLGKVMERGDPEEIQLAYVAVQSLYRRYLEVALNPSRDKNFYHGDLHRENIFFDTESGNLTLIDFGNAGVLDEFSRSSILKILYYTKQTETQVESELDQAIAMLSSALERFIFSFSRERIKESSMTGQLYKTYFQACFNPMHTVADKVYASQQLEKQLVVLDGQKRQVSAAMSRAPSSASQRKLYLVQDDIDIAKAMLSNCLNGPVNTLLSTLASEQLISDKLNLVFDELSRNGLTMPKEVIFFNKSKALLEGLLMNLSVLLEKEGEAFEFIEPDAIYKSVIGKLEGV